MRFARIFALLSLALPMGAAAQAVEVQPQRIERTIAIDHPSDGNLKITNHAQRPVEVRIGADTYRYSQPDLKLPSAKSWITFEPSIFTLGPGASSQVAYHIHPPANLEADTAGEYLAAILVDELPAPPNQEPFGKTKSRITIVPRFAIPVYLQIQGRELIQVEITEISVQLHEKADRLLLKVDTTFKNNGTVHIRPAGTLTLFSSTTGEMISSTPLGQAGPLLPTASAQVPVMIPLPDPGAYKAVITIQMDSNQILQKAVPFEVTVDRDVISGEKADKTRVKEKM